MHPSRHLRHVVEWNLEVKEENVEIVKHEKDMIRQIIIFCVS